ncbi:MAG: IS66 family transposase zinc-finger binding domain-containing protein [Hyphomicrobium sp.]|nr:IS66 family transposase zinc-finger binding domain-containing protein [Hyphomicrobium sp.]
MKRSEHGASSEKSARLLDQLEMQLGELVAAASEGETVSAIARSRSGAEDPVQKPARRPLDEKLQRERVVHAAPCTCRHCGSVKIRKLDEKIAETLEHVPATWKVIQHVREVFTWRECDRICSFKCAAEATALRRCSLGCAVSSAGKCPRGLLIAASAAFPQLPPYEMPAGPFALVCHSDKLSAVIVLFTGPRRRLLAAEEMLLQVRPCASASRESLCGDWNETTEFLQTSAVQLSVPETPMLGS